MQLEELGLAIFDHRLEEFLNLLRPSSLEADYHALLLEGLETQVILVQEDEVLSFGQQRSIIYQTGSTAILRSSG